jgi:hypothetical protein
MKRVEPIQEWAKMGVEGVVQLEEDDPINAKAIVKYGRSIGAVVDKGAGELIFIRLPDGDDGEQFGFPLLGLESSLNNVIKD